MTINSFYKLLSGGNVEIFIVNNDVQYKVELKKVNEGMVPRLVNEPVGYEINISSANNGSKYEEVHIILIKDNVKKKDDLDFLAQKYSLYREVRDEGAYSVMERYESQMGEWYECMAFNDAKERMERVNEIDNNPQSLILYMWEKRKLSPIDRFNTITRCLLRDAKAGLLPDYLAPYLHWKLTEQCGLMFSLQDACEMVERVDADLERYDEIYPDAKCNADYEHLDNPWCYTSAYGEDKRIVAYLQIISDELVSLMESGLLNNIAG